MEYDSELKKFRKAFRNWKILDKYEWMTEDWTGKSYFAGEDIAGEEYFFCYMDPCESDAIDDSAQVCVYLLRDGRMDVVLYWGNETKTFERGDYDGAKNYINSVLTNHGYE